MTKKQVRFLWMFLCHYKIQLTLACALSIAQPLFLYTIAWLTEGIYDAATTGLPAQVASRTLALTLTYLALVFFFYFLAHYCLDFVVKNVSHKMRLKVMDLILKSVNVSRGKVSVGDLLSRLSTDIETIERSVAASVISLIKGPLNVAAAFIYL